MSILEVTMEIGALSCPNLGIGTVNIMTPTDVGGVNEANPERSDQVNITHARPLLEGVGVASPTSIAESIVSPSSTWLSPPTTWRLPPLSPEASLVSSQTL